MNLNLSAQHTIRIGNTCTTVTSGSPSTSGSVPQMRGLEAEEFIELLSPPSPDTSRLAATRASKITPQGGPSGPVAQVLARRPDASAGLQGVIGSAFRSPPPMHPVGQFA